MNQSFSTALSSGSLRKLAGLPECSEKFATRMLYRSLFARIHWQAEITSLVRATPSLFITLTEKTFACGSAPA